MPGVDVVNRSVQAHKYSYLHSDANSINQLWAVGDWGGGARKEGGESRGCAGSGSVFLFKKLSTAEDDFAGDEMTLTMSDSPSIKGGERRERSKLTWAGSRVGRRQWWATWKLGRKRRWKVERAVWERWSVNARRHRGVQACSDVRACGKPKD